MTSSSEGRPLSELISSKRALTIPITFLILFVSTLGMISVTYLYAVERVSTHAQTLKVSMAKQNMMILDENLMSITFQPGSARTFEFDDCDGKLKIQPSDCRLTISITDGNYVNGTVFNETVGQIVYELPYAEVSDTGLFLKGDIRTITNTSGSLMTQLYVGSGAEHAEILLRYRAKISYTTAGTEGNKTVNNVRIYLFNINSSQPLELTGKIPLRASCVSAEIVTLTYNLSYTPLNLFAVTDFNGTSGQVSAPISGTAEGTIINVQTVICNIKVERWLR